MKFMPTYSAIFWTAIVSGAFSIMVAIGLIITLASPWQNLLLDEPQYVALKKELESNAENQQLKQQLREQDVRLRSRYFQRHQFIRRGAYLLAGGLIATLLLMRWLSAGRRLVPKLDAMAPSRDLEVGHNKVARISAVVLVLVLTTVVFANHFASRQPPLIALIEGSTDKEREAVAVDPADRTRSTFAPTKERIAGNWPRFRGFQGAGIVGFNEIPRTWNVATGEGILWKSSIELPGVSSPIVWEDRIFLTGASAERREVYCLDAQNGKLLWKRSVAERDGGDAEIEVESSTGYAASTPATDGQRVYAIFASGDLVAFDFDGNELWSREFGPLDNMYGHASSPATYRDLVIVQLDQGSGDDDQSRLMAIQGASGELVWEVRREVPSSWSTPIVIEFESLPRIITTADPWVIAYAAEDGRELWRVDCLAGDIGPSPVYADGVVYVANDNATVAAIRDGGQGDVTESHVIWTAEYALPDICSPLLTKDLLLVVPSYGGLASYRQKTGGDEPLWENDLGGMLMASPSLVGNHVYLISEDGRGWVVRPHETGLEIIAENDVGQRCSSSPAFGPGRIYIRAENHLFCIGKR